MDSRAKFLSRGGGYTLFLTSDGAVLALKNRKSKLKSQESRVEDAAVLRMNLVGSNSTPRVSGLEELPGKSNYFIGNDPARWRANIPTYAKVKYGNVYTGVDLVYYGNQRHLEYDFVVAPGSDFTAIRLRIAGDGLYRKGAPLHFNSRGDLIVNAGGGQVRFHKPVVYQRTTHNGRRTLLDGHYVLRASKSRIENPESEIEVGFQVAGYDSSLPLVIDPVLSYSTYLGGSDLDVGNAIAVDSSGNAYVTGETASINFPTVGAYQSSNAGASDVFVAKFDPTGTLLYSTYIGGGLSERGNSIAVDSSGNACLTGRTNSTDFPTMNSFQASLLGDFDAFVVEFNPQGNALLYSSYLGGSGNDAGFGIAVDSAGLIYVTGGVAAASMDDFPITLNAYQRLFGGGTNDAFVAKLDPTRIGLASLLYSSFLGGSGMDRGNSIAVDSAGNIYVTGFTGSNDFPTQNALQSTFGGGQFNVFVTKLDNSGSNAVYSTYLSGSGTDQGYGIAADSAGNAYITGEATSTDFSIVNGFQTANGGGSDAFVAKIDPTGMPLLYSTYLGGSGVDIGSGIAVDPSGMVYVTGRTSSTSDFPIANAFQPTYGGGPNDAFATKIDPTQTGAASLVYSSYLGGSGDENPPASGPSGNPSGGIAVDASGNAYVTGGTSSANFPTMNAAQASYGGDPSDAFVVQIGGASAPPDFAEAATPPSQTVAPGNAASYTVTITPGGGFTGDVSLSASGLPSNAGASFNPPVVTIVDSNPQSSMMTVTTDVTTPLGTYPLTITCASGSLQHTASVSLIVFDSAGSADLSITKSGSPNPVEANTNLTYGMNVVNNGPATATAVTVTDTLPPGVIFVSASAPPGTCAGTVTVTCTVDTLTPGGAFPVAIVVKPQSTGSISNTATVSADQPDPNPMNNTATATTTVEAGGGPPTMLDANLSVQTVVSGLTEPTGMVFLAPNDFLVIEKSTGKVKRVTGGVVQDPPVLSLAVNSAVERGLLGIALHPDFANNGFVYLYWTCRGAEGGADCDPMVGDPTSDISQVPLLGNRVDRFVWDGSTLTFDTNLIRLHSYQKDADQDGNFNQPLRGNHNGGKIVFGPDGKLYIVIGDNGRRGNLQNVDPGPLPDGTDDQFGGPQPDNNHLTGVVLRLNDDGTAPADNPFFDFGAEIGGKIGANIQKIFAYGVRNTFGMAFDPQTGILWNEENGDDSFDEINRVDAGANNGWVHIMGPVQRITDFKAIETSARYFGLQQVRWPPTLIADTPEDALARLYMLPGAHYNDPLFSWKYAVAPSPIGFVNGAGLGPQYQGDLFVGAARTFLAGGYLFDFKLTADRQDLDLSADTRLADRVADNNDKFDLTESETLLIGRDFGITTDIQTGPDGNLYVVTLTHGGTSDGAVSVIAVASQSVMGPGRKAK